MLTAFLLCAAALTADPSTSVEIRFVYTADKAEPTMDVEPWIVKAVKKDEKEVVMAMSDWVSTTGSMQRLHSQNGMYIDGKCSTVDGKTSLMLEGCAGGGIELMKSLTPGEQQVFKIEQGLSRVFVAVRFAK